MIKFPVAGKDTGRDDPRAAVEQSADADTARKSGGPERATVEVVLRYDVAADQAFIDAVGRWVAGMCRPRPGASDGAVELTATLVRPVVGTRTTEWELRVAFPSFEMLGRLLDAHQGLLPPLADAHEDTPEDTPEDTHTDAEARWRFIEVDNPVVLQVAFPPAHAEDRGRSVSHDVPGLPS